MDSRLKLKFYCNILRINYSEFINMPIEKQIEVVKNKDINNSKMIEEAKDALIGALYKEKEEMKKFNNENEQVMKLVNKRKEEETR